MRWIACLLILFLLSSALGKSENCETDCSSGNHCYNVLSGWGFSPPTSACATSYKEYMNIGAGRPGLGSDSCDAVGTDKAQAFVILCPSDYGLTRLAVDSEIHDMYTPCRTDFATAKTMCNNYTAGTAVGQYCYANSGACPTQYSYCHSARGTSYCANFGTGIEDVCNQNSGVVAIEYERNVNTDGIQEGCILKACSCWGYEAVGEHGHCASLYQLFPARDSTINVGGNLLSCGTVEFTSFSKKIGAGPWIPVTTNVWCQEGALYRGVKGNTAYCFSIDCDSSSGWDALDYDNCPCERGVDCIDGVQCINGQNRYRCHAGFFCDGAGWHPLGGGNDVPDDLAFSEFTTLSTYATANIYDHVTKTYQSQGLFQCEYNPVCTAGGVWDLNTNTRSVRFYDGDIQETVSCNLLYSTGETTYGNACAETNRFFYDEVDGTCYYDIECTSCINYYENDPKGYCDKDATFTGGWVGKSIDCPMPGTVSDDGKCYYSSQVGPVCDPTGCKVSYDLMLGDFYYCHPVLGAVLKTVGLQPPWFATQSIPSMLAFGFQDMAYFIATKADEVASCSCFAQNYTGVTGLTCPPAGTRKGYYGSSSAQDYNYYKRSTLYNNTPPYSPSFPDIDVGFEPDCSCDFPNKTLIKGRQWISTPDAASFSYEDHVYQDELRNICNRAYSSNPDNDGDGFTDCYWNYTGSLSNNDLSPYRGVDLNKWDSWCRGASDGKACDYISNKIFSVLFDVSTLVDLKINIYNPNKTVPVFLSYFERGQFETSLATDESGIELYNKALPGDELSFSVYLESDFMDYNYERAELSIPCSEGNTNGYLRLFINPDEAKCVSEVCDFGPLKGQSCNLDSDCVTFVGTLDCNRTHLWQTFNLPDGVLGPNQGLLTLEDLIVAENNDFVVEAVGADQFIGVNEVQGTIFDEPLLEQYACVNYHVSDNLIICETIDGEFKDVFDTIPSITTTLDVVDAEYVSNDGFYFLTSEGNVHYRNFALPEYTGVSLIANAFNELFIYQNGVISSEKHTNTISIDGVIAMHGINDALFVWADGLNGKGVFVITESPSDSFLLVYGLLRDSELVINHPFAIGDWDGDGHSDFLGVVFDHGDFNDIGLWRNSGFGSFTKSVLLRNVPEFSGLAVGDFKMNEVNELLLKVGPEALLWDGDYLPDPDPVSVDVSFHSSGVYAGACDVAGATFRCNNNPAVTCGFDADCAQAVISVGGVEVINQANDGHGFNVVRLNSDGYLKDFRVFDMYAVDNPETPQNELEQTCNILAGTLANYLDSVPKGDVLIMAVNSDASICLPYANLKQSIARLGSTEIDNLAIYDSWGLISKAGYGKFAESRVTGGPATGSLTGVNALVFDRGNVINPASLVPYVINGDAWSVNDNTLYTRVADQLNAYSFFSQGDSGDVIYRLKISEGEAQANPDLLFPNIVSLQGDTKVQDPEFNIIDSRFGKTLICGSDPLYLFKFQQSEELEDESGERIRYSSFNYRLMADEFPINCQPPRGCAEGQYYCWLDNTVVADPIDCQGAPCTGVDTPVSGCVVGGKYCYSDNLVVSDLIDCTPYQDAGYCGLEVPFPDSVQEVFAVVQCRLPQCDWGLASTRRLQLCTTAGDFEYENCFSFDGIQPMASDPSGLTVSPGITVSASDPTLPSPVPYFCGNMNFDLSGDVFDANGFYPVATELRVYEAGASSPLFVYPGVNNDGVPVPSSFTIFQVPISSPGPGVTGTYYVRAQAGNYYTSPDTQSGVFSLTGGYDECTPGDVQCVAKGLSASYRDCVGGSDYGCNDWAAAATGACTTSDLCATPVCNSVLTNGSMGVCDETPKPAGTDCGDAYCNGALQGCIWECLLATDNQGPSITKCSALDDAPFVGDCWYYDCLMSDAGAGRTCSKANKVSGSPCATSGHHFCDGSADNGCQWDCVTNEHCNSAPNNLAGCNGHDGNSKTYDTYKCENHQCVPDDSYCSLSCTDCCGSDASNCIALYGECEGGVNGKLWSNWRCINNACQRASGHPKCTTGHCGVTNEGNKDPADDGTCVSNNVCASGYYCSTGYLCECYPE